MRNVPKGATFWEIGQMSRTQKPDLKTIEPYDVSFAKLQPDGNLAETVQKVATAINVQFTESSEKLPFVASRQFEKLLREEKIFLVGPSGSGKSRIIIELLRSKNASYDRIFVINPSNPAGLDSGRENISLLSHQFGRNDLVIWDNFPEGLVKRDLESAFGALEVVNASAVRNLYIALKPTYLEMYRGLTLGIPDIYTHEVTCDLETMKALIKAYGKVEQYRGVFEKYVSANTDRIARILWQKQPLSLTVVDYYKALVDREADKSQADRIDESAALQIAQAWLPVSDYFDRQLEVMKNMPARKRDVEFLYVLRFCYEVGFDRTYASIAALQKGIFGSDPPAEPTRELGTWVYLSGQSYAMHDSAKSAVKLTDYSKMKIASYLSSNFSDLPKGAGELHSLGLFLGKNIQFVSDSTGRPAVVPDQIYEFMKKNASFERAIGRGVGENFELLDDALQQMILGLVNTEIEFGTGLAESLGERFVDLDDYNRNRVLEKMYQGMLFARYFGQSVGRLYGRLSHDFRALVISHAERNPQFADGLGMGLGYAYSALDPELQAEIMDKARKSFEISRGLGFGFGLTFALLQQEDSKKMVALADGNSELDTGFGMGLGVSYAGLPGQLRSFVIERAGKDCEFAFGAAIYAAYFYRESCPPEILALMHSNTEIAYGLGLGFGTVFFYLPEKFQSELGALTKTNVKLEEGFGSGLGMVLQHLPEQAREGFFGRASSSSAFATGLGYGLGYTWQYIGKALREKALALANSNGEFARGLGIGLGCHFDYLKPEYLGEVMSAADKNGELDMGFGTGAAWAWRYYSDDALHIASERMNQKSEFAKGFGFGLARVIRHFSAGEKEKLLARLQVDRDFSEGFGEGTGHYLWSAYDEQGKREFIEQAAGSPDIAKGLGAGIGWAYSFFKGELAFNSDPNLRRGIGAGIGKAYGYLSDGDRAEALRRAEGDVEFATGLGEGMGMAYSYLDAEQKKLAISYLGDSGFSRGLGYGLGLEFPRLHDDLKKQVLARAAHDRQLSLGLGAGIASRASYLSEALAFEVSEVAKNNHYLAAGLGEGLGMAFPKLIQAAKDRLSPWAGIDGFAFGFGIGAGRIRGYLAAGALDDADKFAKSGRFADGLAIGLGSSAAHLSSKVLQETLSKYDGGDFARHFGFSLGHVISMLDGDKKSAVLAMMRNREGFLTGLGEGVGHNLPATGSRLVEQTLQSLDSLDFERGSARGVSESFGHLDLAEAHGMIEYAGSRPEYGKVLGKDLAERFASLDHDKQSQILDALQSNTEFSKEFARGISRNMIYLSPQSQEKIRHLMAKFPHLDVLPDGRMIKQ